MSERKSIAILIDSDNFTIKYYETLRNELNEIGDIFIVRAYGNFDSNIKKDFAEFGINPILQTPYTTGKNATDIRMVIEAMDILEKKFVDCFCLATSDSDFTPLAMRLKEEKIFVIGAGEGKTPNAFKNICNKFINVDEIFKSRGHKDEKVETVHNKKTVKEVKKEKSTNNENDKKIADLVTLVNEIIESKHEEDDYSKFSGVIETLGKRKTDFSPKNYGATNSSALPFFKNILGNYYEFKRVGSIDYIKAKTKKI